MPKNNTSTDILGINGELPASEPRIPQWESDTLNSLVSYRPMQNERTSSFQLSTILSAPTTDIAAQGLKSLSLRIPMLRVDPNRRSNLFLSLQEWDGYVVKIDRDSFTAALIDVTAGSKRAEEEIDFAISDVRDDDLSLLQNGALFRWSIGYQKINGIKQKVSQIIFRRLPAWTRKDITAARRSAAQILAGKDWE